jgi:RNA polymerase sigma-70 factor (ECF subfamily)
MRFTPVPLAAALGACSAGVPVTEYPPRSLRPQPSPAPEPVLDVRTAEAAERRANAAMDRYARGDDAAFADVYDAIAPRVRAFLLRRTRDAATADDLLQQTLLQIHRHRGSYLSGAPVLPWAFAIARRLSIDEFRHRRVDALFCADDVGDGDTTTISPDDEFAGREVAMLVQAELARIPETQRAAFELLRVEGLSHEQAARVLGTTVNAVKLRAFRAYSAIRAVLAARESRSQGETVS